MNNWCKSKIGTFAITASGGTPSTQISEYWENGTVPWINSGELSKSGFINHPTQYITEKALQNSSATLYPKGTVVIALTGATTGKVSFLNIETSGNQSITGIYPNETVDNLYLYYFLSAIRQKILTFNVGSAQPHINKNIVDHLEIIYPIDIEEQKTIGHILFSVDQAINHTESLIAKYQRIKTGMMQDLLTRGIDENGEIRDPATQKFKSSALGLIPEEWNVLSMGAISTRIGDGTHMSVPTTDYGIPFLYVSCIEDGLIRWDKAASVDSSVYQLLSKGRELHKGTVLYTAVGSYGNAAVVQDNRKFSFQRHIAYINPKNEVIVPQFLELWLNSSIMKNYADKTAIGNAQKTLTLADLAMFPIIKPKIKEQKKIISLMKPIENVLKNQQIYLDKIYKLKTGLIRDLFSGRVSVESLIKQEE